MIRKFRQLQFFILAAGLVFTFVGCTNPQSSDTNKTTTPGYVGTWVRSESTFRYTLTLTSSSFTYTDVLAADGSKVDEAAGTITVSDSAISFTVTSTLSNSVSSGNGTWSVSGSTLTIAGSSFAGTYSKG